MLSQIFKLAIFAIGVLIGAHIAAAARTHFHCSEPAADRPPIILRLV